MEGIAQRLEYATAPQSGQEITVNKVKYIPTFFLYWDEQQNCVARVPFLIMYTNLTSF